MDKLNEREICWIIDRLTEYSIECPDDEDVEGIIKKLESGIE